MLKTNKTNVGADASVCPKPTKVNQKNVGVGLDQPNAITLVALVITIIILIILAGVSLNLALGQNGIFVKSKEAVDKYKDEAQKEQNTLENIYQDMQAETGGDDPTPKEPVEYSELQIGDYVNYPVYYDNVATYVNPLNVQEYNNGYYPEDIYANRWRILSIDTETNEVKLISAGVPLNYYHPYESGSTSISVTNLTTNFFSTAIQNSKDGVDIPTKFQFYQSGFKDEDTEGYVTEISKVEELFSKNLTKIGTNSKPDVRSMTKEDLDVVYKEITKEEKETDDETYVNGTKFKELLAIPCKENESDEYVNFFLASANSDYYLWNVRCDGDVCHGSFTVGGVRPVVTLETNVKFTTADTKINGTTTWDIAAPENP